MNPIDDQLNRLFQAAGARPVEELPGPAYGLETRVLAAWRSSRGASVWDAGVLVRGLAFAGFVMVISIWPAINERSSNSDTENLQLADSSVSTDYSP